MLGRAVASAPSSLAVSAGNSDALAVVYPVFLARCASSMDLPTEGQSSNVGLLPPSDSEDSDSEDEKPKLKQVGSLGVAQGVGACHTFLSLQGTAGAVLAPSSCICSHRTLALGSCPPAPATRTAAAAAAVRLLRLSGMAVTMCLAQGGGPCHAARNLGWLCDTALKLPVFTPGHAFSLPSQRANQRCRLHASLASGG